MTYTDEASRLIFHQSNTLLQMVCQVFERICYNYVVEPEFIDLLDEEHALLGVLDLLEEQTEEIIEQVNAQFPRTDQFVTCRIIDSELNLFEVFVTCSEDFTNYN